MKSHLMAKEAAEFLGVTTMTLWRWTRAGRLPVVDFPSTNGEKPIRRYRLVDLETFSKQHRRASIQEKAQEILAQR